MANDPLTQVATMIAVIEPGPRLIDGLLLRDLYIQAGDAATAATIEAGYRMVDITLLRKLATEIGAVQMAETLRVTQDVGPRLIDGTPWKRLAQMGAGQIVPLVAGVSETPPETPSQNPGGFPESSAQAVEEPPTPLPERHGSRRHWGFPHRGGE